MCRFIGKRALRCLVVLIGAVAPGAAQAQDPRRLPFDFVFKKVDELRLERDEARLQNDFMVGDAVSVNRDINRIRRDDWRLWYDRRRIRRDMWLPTTPWIPRPAAAPLQATTLVPHPQYPGYGYFPAEPTRLYPLPQPAQAAGAALAPGPAAQVVIEIINRGPAGTAIDYAIDGKNYKIESGHVQRLAAGTGATIAYNRGGDPGTQQYTLSGGVYEFRPTDSGLAFFKLPQRAASNSSPAVSARIPRNDLPASVGASKPDHPQGTDSEAQR